MLIKTIRFIANFIKTSNENSTNWKAVNHLILNFGASVLKRDVSEKSQMFALMLFSKLKVIQQLPLKL